MPGLPCQQGSRMKVDALRQFLSRLLPCFEPPCSGEIKKCDVLLHVGETLIALRVRLGAVLEGSIADAQHGLLGCLCIPGHRALRDPVKNLVAGNNGEPPASRDSQAEVPIRRPWEGSVETAYRERTARADEDVGSIRHKAVSQQLRVHVAFVARGFLNEKEVAMLVHECGPTVG